MKRLLLIALFLSFGFSQSVYNANDIIQMDNGLWTVKFSDEPITGNVYGYFGEEGNLKTVWMGKVLNGKKEGTWKFYYHSTGRKKYEKNYKDGKPDGLWTWWHSNGKKSRVESFKDGIEHGLITIWYENGQKKYEGTYKDGKEDGKWTGWYESGQKRGEATFKDGEEIPKKCWDEDGNVEECR